MTVMLVYGTGSFHQIKQPGGAKTLTCDGITHVAGGVKVVERTSVVVGCVGVVASGWESGALRGGSATFWM